MNARIWALLLVLFVGGCHAAPRLRCAVRPSQRAVRESRARGFSDISVFSEACSDADTTAKSARASASASASAGGRSVGVSAVSSTGDGDFRPFRVSGGDAVDTEDREETVVIVETEGRPVGPWYFVVEAELATSVTEAWITMRNFGNILLYGLEGFHKDVRSLDPKNKKWAVDLISDERIVFDVKESNGKSFYHLVTIESHTPLVFPGVNVRGSSLFVHFIPKSNGYTLVQFGWGGRVNGPKDVALLAIGSLGQELLDNLQEHYGELCNDEKSIRTIEGDCNNLGDPRRAAAGHALVRLGGSDPSFPGNNPTIPSGPTHISPRVISNELCSTSPGREIMQANARVLKGKCYNADDNGNRWKICPYREASVRFGRRGGYRLEWDGLVNYKDGSIGMKFSGAECDLELALVCHGASSVVLVDEPCGKPGNRLFHPIACRIRPGKDEVLQNSRALTDLFWTFGQFVDHDLGLTPVTAVTEKKQPGFSRLSRSGNEEFPVPVPRHDFFLKEREMEFERTTLLKDRSRGLHENQHSAYADLGQVYGVDFLRARALRSFRGGKLKVQRRNLPPFNKISGPGALRAKVDNAPDDDEKLFAVGDARGNEQTLLLAMHIIWLREHNRVCDELSIKFPQWSDERLYQTARAIVIAEYQSILYNEWLPLLLGEGAVPAAAYAYDASVDASITAIFSTSAFRIGHTMVGSFLLKLGPGPRSHARLERVPLRNAFFKPELVIREGIDDFVRGAAWHLCKEVDIKVVDEVRNFLFTEDERKGHLDLVSLNLQRGRDMGLPSFNDMRSLFGLPKYSSFYDFMSDADVAAAADRVYEENVDQCDSFIGGIAEKTFPGSLLGETFHVIIRDQFTKIRDGDRFFYRGLDWDNKILTAYPRLNDILADKVKLIDILVRNTGIRYQELGHRESNTVFKI